MTDLRSALVASGGVPFHWRPLLHTHDLSTANRAISTIADALHFSAGRRGRPWEIHVTGIALEHLKLFGVRHSPFHVVSSEPLQSHHVVIPLRGTLSVRVDSQTVDVCPGEAVVYPAGARISAQWYGLSVALVLAIDRDQYQRISRFCGPVCSRPFPFAPKLNLWRGAGRSFSNLVQCLCDECANLEDATGSAVTRGLEELILYSLLRTQVEAEPATTEVVTTRRRRSGVQRTVAYLHANSGRTVTIAELCNVACLSPRSLQIAFVEHYGVGPMTYARILRLEGARRELADGLPGEVGIRDVAQRWGFNNASTFSRLYSRQFGELPSATLRRARPCVIGRDE